MKREALLLCNAKRIAEVTKKINMGRIIRKKVIMVSPDSRDKLAEVFNTTKTTVLRSLNYSSNSAQAQNIRQQALSNYGGIEVVKPTYIVR